MSHKKRLRSVKFGFSPAEVNLINDFG